MKRPRALVLAAIAVVVLLAASLAVRLLGRDRGGAPAPAPVRLPRCAALPSIAPVPAPSAPGALKTPCWGCPEANEWPVAFRTDLDLLAPLGKGTANAALWLKDFSREVGAREGDASLAMKRRVEGPADFGKVLPGDDPLLAEADPWADQAVMRFYPDAFGMQGFETRLPDLLFALTLGKSWAARAAAHPGSPAAIEDGRRAIRWGRLLRQDDATIVQDLVALACIRLGAEQLYEAAVRNGDHPLALASAMVLGEHAPQRLRTAQLLTRFDLTVVDGFDTTLLGRVFAGGRNVSEKKLDAILEVARSAPDRRFRLEAIHQLAIVRAAGSRAQRGRAEKALDGLSASADPLVSAASRWARLYTTSPSGHTPETERAQLLG